MTRNTTDQPNLLNPNSKENRAQRFHTLQQNNFTDENNLDISYSNIAARQYALTRKNRNERLASRDKFKTVIIDDTPGPGAYEALRNANITGCKFFRTRKLRLIENGVPGPGAYDIATSCKTVLKNTPDSVIGRAERSPLTTLNSNQNGPGPADYNVPDCRKYKKLQNSTTISFGKDSKHKHNPKENLPGPGTYNTSENSTIATRKQNACSFKGRRMKLRTQQSPGPVDYVPKIEQLGRRPPSAMQYSSNINNYFIDSELRESLGPQSRLPLAPGTTQLLTNTPLKECISAGASGTHLPSFQSAQTSWTLVLDVTKAMILFISLLFFQVV